VLESFSATFEAGDKVAIVGANGAGKTTLLRCLLAAHPGGLSATEGRVRWAENADVGYMAQDVYPDFESEDTVTEWIGRYTQAGDDDQAVRGILGRLLFSGDDVTKNVRVLSGGEKHRMSFGRLMLGRHNVLMLDEPTNHLDMESIESLQLALEKFEGTLFVVSHDRQFIDALATRVLVVHGNGKVTDWRGGYEEYLDSIGVD
jgi:ATPase subunit of ABC transporter with duplicated ATPase domains